jgi:hypothetical protein
VQTPLNLDLPEPEWIGLCRAEVAKGKTISQVARECGMPRSSLSMLLSGDYPAQSLDLVTRKYGQRIVQIYRDAVICPHLHRSIPSDECRAHAEAPMTTSRPEKLRQWRACRRCPLNPLPKDADQ